MNPNTLLLFSFILCYSHTEYNARLNRQPFHGNNIFRKWWFRKTNDKNKSNFAFLDFIQNIYRRNNCLLVILYLMLLFNVHTAQTQCYSTNTMSQHKHNVTAQTQCHGTNTMSQTEYIYIYIYIPYATEIVITRRTTVTGASLIYLRRLK